MDNETYSVYQVREADERRVLHQMEIPTTDPIPEGWTEILSDLEYEGKTNEQVDTNSALMMEMAKALVEVERLKAEVAELKGGN